MPRTACSTGFILAPYAVKRLIEPAGVAATVAFLLSPDGSVVTAHQ